MLLTLESENTQEASEVGLSAEGRQEITHQRHAISGNENDDKVRAL